MSLLVFRYNIVHQQCMLNPNKNNKGTMTYEFKYKNPLLTDSSNNIKQQICYEGGSI